MTPDHRKLGRQLELFFFDELSPGAPFWLPKGMVIFKELERFIREETDSRGYEETATPTLIKTEIFRQSGHWEHFRQNMFSFEIDGNPYSLKPMNCPESTLLYRFKTRSYRDLPLRFSELSPLFRRERTGTVGGLFRVRQLTMDDAHVYCRPDQIKKEIEEMLGLILSLYKKLALPVSFSLATKPKKSLGKAEDWDDAETQLGRALKGRQLKYKTLPKEGAFYGPKIHVDVTDSLGRVWTLATIQVDFQMPARFQLEYVTPEGKGKRPVMIHRAVFGSIERFIGILLEHSGGALPVWLSPVQAVVIPVSEKYNRYAVESARKLQGAGIRLKALIEEGTLSAKVREAELQNIPYILVVGEREKKEGSVALRLRDGKDLGRKKITSVEERIQKISLTRSLAL